MPLHAEVPEVTGGLGGMNGCQFAGLTYMNPNPITSITIATLMYTMTLLNRADSLMPITSSVVIAATSITAGRLMTPPRHAVERLRAALSHDEQAPAHERRGEG